jgi:hypothetical protein
VCGRIFVCGSYPRFYFRKLRDQTWVLLLPWSFSYEVILWCWQYSNYALGGKRILLLITTPIRTSTSWCSYDVKYCHYFHLNQHFNFPLPTLTDKPMNAFTCTWQINIKYYYRGTRWNSQRHSPAALICRKLSGGMSLVKRSFVPHTWKWTFPYAPAPGPSKYLHGFTVCIQNKVAPADREAGWKNYIPVSPRSCNGICSIFCNRWSWKNFVAFATKITK